LGLLSAAAGAPPNENGLDSAGLSLVSRLLLVFLGSSISPSSSSSSAFFPNDLGAGVGAPKEKPLDVLADGGVDPKPKVVFFSAGLAAAGAGALPKLKPALVLGASFLSSSDLDALAGLAPNVKAGAAAAGLSSLLVAGAPKEKPEAGLGLASASFLAAAEAGAPNTNPPVAPDAAGAGAPNENPEPAGAAAGGAEPPNDPPKENPVDGADALPSSVLVAGAPNEKPPEPIDADDVVAPLDVPSCLPSCPGRAVSQDAHLLRLLSLWTAHAWHFHLFLFMPPNCSAKDLIFFVFG